MFGVYCDAEGMRSSRRLPRHGISIFAGEAEGRFDAVLRDAAQGKLAPVYNFMSDLPDMDGVPLRTAESDT